MSASHSDVLCVDVEEGGGAGKDPRRGKLLESAEERDLYPLSPDLLVRMLVPLLCICGRCSDCEAGEFVLASGRFGMSNARKDMQTAARWACARLSSCRLKELVWGSKRCRYSLTDLCVKMMLQDVTSAKPQVMMGIISLGVNVGSDSIIRWPGLTLRAF